MVRRESLPRRGDSSKGEEWDTTVRIVSSTPLDSPSPPSPDDRGKIEPEVSGLLIQQRVTNNLLIDLHSSTTSSCKSFFKTPLVVGPGHQLQSRKTSFRNVPIMPDHMSQRHPGLTSPLRTRGGGQSGGTSTRITSETPPVVGVRDRTGDVRVSSSPLSSVQWCTGTYFLQTPLTFLSLPLRV